MAQTFAPVRLVASGGLPVTVVTNGYGTPMTVMPDDYIYAASVTVCDAGMPVVLYDPDGTLNTGVGVGVLRDFEGALLRDFENQPLRGAIR